MDKNNEIGFIFLAGAGLGSWVWNDVVRSLKQPYVCVDFPKQADSTMEDYIRAALQQAEKLPTTKVVIVGHSLGGTIGLKLAEILAERLEGFVAVAAAIPKQGGSFLSSLPFPQKLIMPLIIRFAGTKPSDEAIRKGYCNDLSEALANEVVKLYTPESAQVYSSASALPPLHVPRMYVQTLRDNEFPASLQEAMRRNLQTDQVVTIDSGHLPMLSKPKELATALNDFSQNIRS